MLKLRHFYKFICFIILFISILTFRTSTTTVESKVSNTSLNKNLNLNAMAQVIDTFVKSDIYTPLDTYTGRLTGYGADCPLCSGKLGCNGQDVRDGTTTYNDKTYGTVRIVASSKNLACGSIVRFENNTENITAIVLDRGVLGTALDLLVESESAADYLVGSQKINYDILRYGWER